MEETNIMELGRILRNETTLDALEEDTQSKLKQTIEEMAGAEDAYCDHLRCAFESFKTNNYTTHPDLFAALAQNQTPKYMVFACCDSRVSPTTILNFEPGAAFTVRNIANMVPPYDKSKYCGTGAALEYAVLHLKVENIMVIGHCCCGGIKGLMAMADDGSTSSEFIEDWVSICKSAKNKVLAECSDLDPKEQITRVEREAVNVSLGNLLTYPFVREAVSQKRLSLKGGYYDFVDGSLDIWDISHTLCAKH